MASLLDWLGGQVEGAFAQANPFDNGATYNSVQKRRRDEELRRQAQQAAQQARQAAAPRPAQASPMRPPAVGPQLPSLTFNPATQSVNSVVNATLPTPRPSQPNLLNDIAKGTVGFIGDVGKYFVDTGTKAANTAALLPVQVTQAATGTWNDSQAKKIRDDIQKRSFISDKIISGKATPLEFAQGFTNAGIETSNLVPIGGAVKGLATGLSKEAVKQAAVSNAKQALIYGTANTANDAINNRPITTQQVALNYGAPFLLGTTAQVAGGAIKSAGKGYVNAADQYVNTPRPQVPAARNAETGYMRVGYPNASDLPENVQNRIINNQASRLAADQLKAQVDANKMTPTNVAAAMGDSPGRLAQKDLQLLADNIPAFKKNPVMTFNPSAEITTAGYGRNPQTVTAPVFEYKSGGQTIRLNAQNILPEGTDLSRFKAGEQVDFSPALVKKSSNKVPAIVDAQPGAVLPATTSADDAVGALQFLPKRNPTEQLVPTGQRIQASPTTKDPLAEINQNRILSSPSIIPENPTQGTKSTIKVKQAASKRNVPVMQVEQTGDVVTKTNVNSAIRKGEKRYTVTDTGDLVEDRKGAYRLFHNKKGEVTGLRIGDEYFAAKDIGDLSKVNDYGSTLATMRRNVERAFDPETGDKVSRFLVDHQQAQATKMINRQIQLANGTKQLAKELDINFATGRGYAKKVSAAIQDYGEKVKTKQQLINEFGLDQANKIVAADKWFRSQYDTLLNEMNDTLTRYGYDPVPKRANYYTHFQDESLWRNFGLKMQEIRDLASPTLQDADPSPVRGKISNQLAGMSEQTKPNKMFNRFALQRKGNQRTADAFGAFERYLNPTLSNIYMTPSITRARVIARAIADAADVAGKDADKIIYQVREWANSLAGKSNRFDRSVLDTNTGPVILKTLGWAQRKAGQNTIVGNLSTAFLQPVVLAQTTGRFGFKNTLLAMMQEFNKKSTPAAQSEFLQRRYANLNRVTESALDKARTVANKPLEVVERTATEITWNAAHNEALSKGLKGAAALRYADINTEKTVAGRAIGEKPELFRSKLAGPLTMYQLEVSNFWQQIGKEMTKAQAARTLVAAYGINMLFQNTIGREVSFNPINAAIDAYNEGSSDNPLDEKAKKIGQRFAGEVLDNTPIIPQAITTLFGEKAIKDITGRESNIGRFGVSSPLRTLLENPLYALSPFGGSQIKKTAEAAQALSEGKITNKDGETTVDVPVTPENIIKGLLFGKSAIPEVNTYYKNKSKKDAVQTPVPNQIDSLAKNQGDGMTSGSKAPDSPLLQAALKTKKIREDAFKQSLSNDDYTIAQMSEADQQQLVSDGIITQEKLDGLKEFVKEKKKELGYKQSDNTRELADSLSIETADILKKYDSLNEKKRKEWFSTENDAEYLYKVAKYENDKALGLLSKSQLITAEQDLRKSQVGIDFNKEVRELYGVSESELADYLSTPEKGVDKQAIANQLLAYDQRLKDAGIITRLKYKGGILNTKGKSGGGRGKGAASGRTLISLAKSANKVRAPRTTGSRGLQSGLRAPQMKKAAQKRFAVKRTSVSKIRKLANPKA